MGKEIWEACKNEIGISLIHPDTHYTMTPHQEKRIKAYLARIYPGVVITHEIMDTFIQNEEDWYVECKIDPESESHPFHEGPKFPILIDGDRCETGQDRLDHMYDHAINAWEFGILDNEV